MSSTPRALEVGEDRQPEVGALGAVADPMSQDVAMAFGIDRKDDVDDDGLDSVVLAAQLDVQPVKEHDGVDRGQRPGLPGGHQRHDLVRDGADGRRGDVDAVKLLKHVLDVPHRLAAGVERQDLLLDLVGLPLVGSDDLRLEGAVAIPGHRNRLLAALGLERASIAPVSAVAGVPADDLVRFVAQMRSDLAFEHLLDGLGEQPGEDPVLAVEVVDRLGRCQLGHHAFRRRHRHPRPPGRRLHDGLGQPRGPGLRHALASGLFTHEGSPFLVPLARPAHGSAALTPVVAGPPAYTRVRAVGEPGPGALALARFAIVRRPFSSDLTPPSGYTTFRTPSLAPAPRPGGAAPPWTPRIRFHFNQAKDRRRRVG